VELLQEIRHDISPPLRDIKPLVRPLGPPEAKEIRLLHPPREVKRMPDAAMQTSTLAKISTTAGVNFDGVAANGSAPPDTNGSAGTTQFVEWVNTEFAVYDKTGRLLLGPVLGNTLWSGFGPPCETTNDGDIVVLFDKLNNRWVMSQLSINGTPPFNQCVAVSTTSDATGTFARYAFQQPNFNDYPKLGVWPDAYYVSYNIFDSVSGFFQGARLCAMDGAAMRAGSAATQQCFPLSTNFGSVLPSDVDGTTPPPAGEPAFFLGFDNNLSSLDLWKFHVDFAAPGNSTLTGPVNLAVSPFNEACGGGTCVPQSGTSQQLDSLGDRVMYRLAYRNFGSRESLVVNHSITAGSGVGVRWYEIQSPAGNPVVFQSGTFAPDSSYRWMGSIAMDKVGNIALGYSVSSGSLHPAIRYTGRVPSDPLGTMETETSIIEGPGSQINFLHRWGDYSSMSVDPVDDCTFWYSSEYQPSNGAFNWHTRIASFKFPGCGQSLTPTTTTLSASPASSTYGTSVTFTATVGPTSGTGTPSGTVTFSDGGTNLGTGTLDTSGKATFATSTLSAGSRSLTATYGGNSTFGGSASAPLAYAVTKANTSTSVSSNNSASAYGQSVTFTATVSPSAATGTVQFFDGGTSLGTATLSGGRASVSTSSLAVGNHSITATYNGNSNYNTSASGTVSLTVSKATSTTSLASSVNPSTLGQSATFTAAVSPSAATGTVQFFDGGTSLGTATLSGGRASVSTSSLAVGNHSITATYSGDANNTGSSSSTLTQTVNSAPAGDFSLSATPSSQTVVQGNGTTFTATVSAVNGFGGTVSFNASGLPAGAAASFNPTSRTSSGSSTMTVTTSTSTLAGTYRITITGTSGSLSHSTTVSLTVNAAGQANYSLSASPSSLTITQGNSGTSTITVTPQNGFTGSVSLSASGLPSGVTPSFIPSSTTSTSTLTLTASSTATTGSVTVTITGTSGGLTHTTTIALTVNAGPNFSLSASPNSLSVARGSTGTSTITINPTNSFNGSVSFSASNLPTGVTAAFSPNPSTSNSTVTLTVSSSATTGTFSVRVRGRSGSLSHSVRISLTVR
jgi:hypothetical protein